MRVIVVGAGAIGGTLGGLLFRAGHEVELVARGPHYQALRSEGLRLEVPGETFRLPVPARQAVSEVDWSRPAVALLAVKGQHTADLLDQLGSVAPESTPVACAQNGVDNERQALRRFPATYGVCVMCPASHLRPGLVQVHSWPVPGLLDLGCYPSGLDATARGLAGAFEEAGFESRPLEDIMRWKYRKLLLNLGNGIEVLCGREGRRSELARLALDEGETVLEAAGIEVASRAEDAERRGDRLKVQATASGPTTGSSSWQSLARGTGSIETDWLNGEISLLGRLHGVPTPVNDLIRRRADELARSGGAPGSTPASELLAELGVAAS